MTTRAEIETERQAVKMECIAQVANIRLLQMDMRGELDPLHEQKSELNLRIEHLKTVKPDEWKDMGYSSQQEVDETRRALEGEYNDLRVTLATKEAYWREKIGVKEEENVASNEKLKKLDAKLKNFKE